MWRTYIQTDRQTDIWTSMAVAGNNFIKWVLFHCKIMTDNNSYYRWPGEVVKIFLNKATNQRWVLKLQFLILDQASHVAWSWTLYRGREDEDDIMLRRLLDGLTAPARNEKQKNQLFLMYASMLSGGWLMSSGRFSNFFVSKRLLSF